MHTWPFALKVITLFETEIVADWVALSPDWTCRSWKLGIKDSSAVVAQTAYP